MQACRRVINFDENVFMQDLTLGTFSVLSLMGQPARAVARRGPAPKLQHQMERIARLPRTKQQLVIDMLDGVLAQAGR